METFDTILTNFLNGEPLHDAIVIGCLFAIFMVFYNTLFTAIFSFFKTR